MITIKIRQLLFQYVDLDTCRCNTYLSYTHKLTLSLEYLSLSLSLWSISHNFSLIYVLLLSLCPLFLFHTLFTRTVSHTHNFCTHTSYIHLLFPMHTLIHLLSQTHFFHTYIYSLSYAHSYTYSYTLFLIHLLFHSYKHYFPIHLLFLSSYSNTLFTHTLFTHTHTILFIHLLFHSYTHYFTYTCTIHTHSLTSLIV